MAEQISQTEVEELGSRLDEFALTLSPAQQQLLASMLQSAATQAGGEEAQGYIFSTGAGVFQTSTGGSTDAKMLGRAVDAYARFKT